MSKLEPRQRWENQVDEAFGAFEVSGELGRLREEGLAVLGRLLGKQEMLAPAKWHETFHARASSPEYRVWKDQCGVVGQRFGLNADTIAFACLLEGYSPRESYVVVESGWPELTVVTENSDPAFLARLTFEAQKLGLRVVQKTGGIETVLVVVGVVPPPMPTETPPRSAGFFISFRSPPLFPSEARQEWVKQSASLERLLFERLGYPTRERQRSSRLTAHAKTLKVGEGPLPSGGVYDIVDEVYGDGSDWKDDQQRRNTIKSQRHKLQERFGRLYPDKKNPLNG